MQPSASHATTQPLSLIDRSIIYEKRAESARAREIQKTPYGRTYWQEEKKTGDHNECIRMCVQNHARLKRNKTEEKSLLINRIIRVEHLFFTPLSFPALRRSSTEGFKGTGRCGAGGHTTAARFHSILILICANAAKRFRGKEQGFF